MGAISMLRNAARDPCLAVSRIIEKLTTPEYVVLEKGSRSDSDSGAYGKILARANSDPKVFRTFRRHPYYTGILEHVTGEQGEKYLEIIEAESPELVAKMQDFRANDLVGSPKTFYYESAGQISPTTLRYIKVASDLRKAFGSLDDMRIAEIGVGYGGQLLILDRIWKIKDYTLFDLDPALALTSKYLESFTLNTAYVATTLNRFREGSFDLVISNYAFSELPSQLQQRYFQKVLKGSCRGYMTMNSGKELAKDKLSVAQLRRLIPSMRVEAERPLTGPENYVVLWVSN